MSYATIEQSSEEAKPLELYLFSGTYEDFSYTSGPEEITSGGVVYSPIFITRNALKIETGENTDNTLEISLPFDNPMVRSYAYRNAPPDLTLELRRAHEQDVNDTVLMWTGRVTGFSVDGRVAKLKVPSLFSYILKGNTPTPRYQGPCNHVLYDNLCGVDPALNQHISTVVSISSNVIQLDTLPFLQNEAAAGQIFNSSGEQRMVVSNVGTSVTVTYEFANLSIGDTLTIRKGCDHSFEGDCKTKFNNGDRFGGFPLVPGRNPFTSTLT